MATICNDQIKLKVNCLYKIADSGWETEFGWKKNWNQKKKTRNDHVIRLSFSLFERFMLCLNEMK